MKTYKLPQRPDIAERIRIGLQRYLNRGIPPGGFLTAVLSNDLARAAMTADRWNKQRIPEVVRYVYNHVPPDAWGSREAMREWQAKRLREEGLEERQERKRAKWEVR